MGENVDRLCEDDTDCIIFCVCHQNAKLLNDKFKAGSAYMLQNATGNICKPRFALKPKKLHLGLDDKSVVLPSNDKGELACLHSIIHSYSLHILCTLPQPFHLF